MAWERIKRVAKANAKHLADGVPKWSDPGLAPRVLALLASDGEATPTLELDVPAAALVGTPYWFESREKSRWPEFVARWIAHDLAFAVSALFASMTLEHEIHDDHAISVRARTDRDGLAQMGPLPWSLVRDALNAAKPAARAKALVAAPSSTLLDRFLRTYLFPQERFGDADRDWGLVTSEDAARDGSLRLAYALALAGDAKCMTAAARSDNSWSAFYEVKPDALVREIGDRAMPMLRVMLFNGWGELDTHTSEALVTREGPVVARIAADVVERHHAGAVVRSWLAKRPSLAIPALASRIAEAKRGESTMASSSLLSSLVLAHRDVATEARGAMTAAARAILDGALEETKPLPDASPSELPSALAVPPWRAPKTNAKPSAVVYPKLDRLPYAESVAWGEHSAEDVADRAFHSDGERSKKRDASILTSLSRERKKAGYTFIFRTGELTDGVALETLRDWGPDAFYYDASDVIGIVARFGLEELELAIRYAAGKADTVTGLANVDSARVAPHMAHVAVNLKKKKDVGEAWLARFPEAAAIGLIPALSEQSGKDRATIEEALRILGRDAADVLASVAKRYGAPAVEAVDAVLASSAFAKPPKKIPKMPAFWDATRLPRPRLAIAPRALSIDATNDLGVYLALSKRERFHPALYAIRSACDRPSLARFAWALFSEWLGAGASTKDDFGFFVLGVFGDDAAARALQPMIKAWAPGGFPTRAQMGVDVLAALGTPVALEMVYKTATKVRSKALARHAEEMLEKIASRLHLSREELADRLVPDLDFDDRGTRTFAYGNRTFVARIGDDLKAYVDLGGKRVADLPKPTRAEEEEGVREEYESFKDMKKRLREVVTEQTRRLELALVTRRRFDRASFEERFVRHPLMRIFATRLVWGAYGKSVRAFRIAEDGFVGADDRAFEVADGELVGLVHPIELDAKTLAAWSERFADYRIVQPIAQLGRETRSGAAPSLAGRDVDTARLLDLERRFWKRANAGQGGTITHYEKSIGDIVARVSFDPGIQLGDPKSVAKQQLETLSLARGGKPIALAELDAPHRSELLFDLESLA